MWIRTHENILVNLDLYSRIEIAVSHRDENKMRPCQIVARRQVGEIDDDADISAMIDERLADLMMKQICEAIAGNQHLYSAAH